MINFLLGWCVVSLIGTLIALRLIRNGRSSHDNRHLAPDIAEEAKPEEAVSQLPDARSIEHPAGHSQ